MTYFLTFYRNGLLQLSLTLVLFLWAITSTVYAVKQTPQTILIGLTTDGAKLISDKDRASEVEPENFLRRFVGLAFNYTEKTYEENVGLASDLMDEALFDKQKVELQKVNEALKSRTLVQSAVITEIKRLEPDQYELLVKTDQLLDQKNDSFMTRVRLRIKKSERTTRNPWGLEAVEFTYDRT